MKKTLIATSVVAAFAMHGHMAGAAEINDQGARSLQDSLGAFLPEKLKKSDFLTVKPVGGKYDITYDFAKLLDSIGTKDVIVSGLTPFIVSAAPLDNGQWKLNSTNNLNVSATAKGPEDKVTDITYSVTDMVFSGLFDPAISYLRSAEATSGPIRMVSKSGPEMVEASFAGVNYSLTSGESATAGGLDFKGNGSFSRFYERIEAPQVPPVQIRADNIAFDVGVNGVVANKLKNLVSFVFDLAKNEKPSPAEIDKLKGLIRDTMPFFTALSEKVSFNQFTVASQVGDFGVGKLDYTLTMSEPSQAARIGIGARLENISAPSTLVPQLYAQLVPDLADIEIGLADLNFTRFVDTLMQMDFSKPGPLPEAESAKLGKALLKDGKLTVDFPKIIAKSPLYDLEASGKMRGNPEVKDDYSIESTVYARDIDKLIGYLQKASKTDKQFTQASFGLMLAKGMAKTDPDGRLRWDLKFDGKSVSVNGQTLR